MSHAISSMYKLGKIPFYLCEVLELRKKYDSDIPKLEIDPKTAIYFPRKSMIEIRVNGNLLIEVDGRPANNIAKQIRFGVSLGFYQGPIKICTNDKSITKGYLSDIQKQLKAKIDSGDFEMILKKESKGKWD